LSIRTRSAKTRWQTLFLKQKITAFLNKGGKKREVEKN
jgi:hypothetical protein